jgi:Fur family ferric uptake transcriptional regulator
MSVEDQLINKLGEILLENGQSQTKVRRAILLALIKFSRPVSIKKIIETAGVDAASVYRNIDLFTKLNIIQRVPVGWKTFYELGERLRPHHHHLVCAKCSKIIEIDENRIEDLLSLICKENKFTPKDHHFEVSGVCYECKNIMM